MNRNFRRILPRCLVSLLFLWFFVVGGCDIDFGSGNNSGGGGGGGGSQTETIQGTIVSIVPDQNVAGITVDISIDNGVPVSDVTNASGFFSIDGDFAGNPQISFSDSKSNPLGTAVLNIFPTAQADLGDITLDSGTVDFQNQTNVTFDGKLTTLNCTDNSGSMEVTAQNSQAKTTVIVQISASTNLVDSKNNAITCSNFLTGQSLQIQGDITSGNTVNASRVQVN